MEQKREREGGHKDFKKGQSGSKGGCLKGGGDWNPLTNYAQVFSCETCEIVKKNYFEEHLQTTAS